MTNTNDSGTGSLRQTILNANANAGMDTIEFNIPGMGPHTIQPTSALPTITDPVIIDGYTQPGASPNTNPSGSGTNAVLKIELDGSSTVAGADGLHITAGGSTVRGLVINRFSAGPGPSFLGDGIELNTGGGNVIEGNFIGTDVTGTIALGNSAQGIRILFSPNNTIGGTTPAARNVISGNDIMGVDIFDSGGETAGRTIIQGNFIGTNAAGTIDLGNGVDGVFINNMRDNTIGGTTAGAANIISGNNSRGVRIRASTGNLVQGNFIGTDVTGTIALGNSSHGVLIFIASNNTIGGTTAGAGNTIAFNGGDGISIDPFSSPPSTGNAILANSIFSNAGLMIVLVSDGVTLTLDQDGSATNFFVGNGTSGVVNQSAETVTATNLDISAGGTYTQSGTGVLNTTNTTIGAGGALTLVNQGTGAIDGAAAGQGGLTFAGNYDTDVAIGGTNSLDSITVNNGATLDLDQAASATNLIIGGVLNKSSTKGITAATTINDGGTMTVTASFTHTGNLTVGQGASGTLDVTTTTVNVTGDFNMAAGATFKTKISSGMANDSGKIVATGDGTVPAGTTMDITVAESAPVVSGTTYKVIDGAGAAGVNVPTTISDNSAGLDFVGSTDGADLIITAQTAAALLTGLSPNATTVNNSLSGMLVNDAELALAFAGLTTAQEFNAALESLTPDISGAVLGATFAAHNSSINTVGRRLASLRTGAGMMTGMAAGDPYRDVSMWLQGFGSTIDQDNRGGARGFDADTVGTSYGVDKLVTDNLRMGAAFSYASSDVDTKGSRNSTDIDSYQGVLYASYESGPWFLDGVFSYARNDYDGTRYITVGGVNRVASGDYGADQVAVKATAGREYRFNSNVDLNPYVGLHYVYLGVDGYREKGAGAANLRVRDETSQMLRSTLGVSVRKEIKRANGFQVVPEAHMAWLHEFLDEGQTNSSTFTGGGGSFTTRGFDPANDSLNVGASLAIYSGSNFDVKATYDFEVKDDYKSHSGMLTVRYNF